MNGHTDCVTLFRTCLSDEERAALYSVNDLLNKIYGMFDDNFVLVSMTTGECIMIDELPRMGGILDALSAAYAFEVTKKEE